MILVIDNYDSFVHNLARYFRQLGCETMVLRNDLVDKERVEELNPRAIVISPGPCTPNEAGNTLDLIRDFSAAIPILGICLGHQAIVQAFGGKVDRAFKPVHGRQSAVRHQGTKIFADVPSPFLAARYHSLVAPIMSVPSELVISARTDDGIVMAVEHQTLPVIGLQFHPESVLTEHGYRMLANFCDIADIPHDDPINGNLTTQQVQPIPSSPFKLSDRLSIKGDQ